MSLLDSISNFPKWAIAAHLVSIHRPPNVEKAMEIADMILALHEFDEPSLCNLVDLYWYADRYYESNGD
jgi:hypothetical protein